MEGVPKTVRDEEDEMEEEIEEEAEPSKAEREKYLREIRKELFKGKRGVFMEREEKERGGADEEE